MNSIVTVVNNTFKVKRGDPKSSQPKEKNDANYVWCQT